MDKPNIGERVTVTTRYRDISIYSDQEFVEYTYTGIVSKPEPWYKDNQFKLIDDEPGRMVYRTLDMNSIVKLELL